jgi:hypothetical protein
MGSSGEFVCPVCGADVARSAMSCQECGADEATGWSETAEDDALELPEEMGDDEYEEFLSRELPDAAPRRAARRKLLRAFVGIVLVALLSWWAAHAL